ncbi:ABC transporter G family member 36-like isoform X4 [Ricinus communis]|uniref:ABC transporter G family member 36-like isoform X4 n=1 Tax=Ricinus communis TaxID=3988 RepID=UPI00201AA26C|nr:ABC transporter G family member 36-like isoform X4 [Ricinus communis]
MLEVTTPAQEIALGVDFADIYRNSEQYRIFFRRHKAIIKELSTRAPDSKDLYFPTKYSQSLLIQCIACLREQHWSYWRNSSYNAVRFIHTTITALMLGTVFWRLGSKKEKPQDLFNAMGSMYAAVLFLGIKSASAVQPVVAAERTFFYRERASGMYSALPYAFAQVLIELPYNFIADMVYGVIVHTMLGFEITTVKIFWHVRKESPVEENHQVLFVN